MDDAVDLPQASSTGEDLSTSEQRTYEVSGMTCEHCVAAVVEEVGAAPGVQGVDVDLDSGRMVVSGTDIDDATIRAAVEEAGYSTV
jgi:copper chaperone CopZ